MQALAIIRETDTLQFTYNYLMAQRSRLYQLAEELHFAPFRAILERLPVMAPSTADININEHCKS